MQRLVLGAVQLPLSGSSHSVFGNSLFCFVSGESFLFSGSSRSLFSAPPINMTPQTQQCDKDMTHGIQSPVSSRRDSISRLASYVPDGHCRPHFVARPRNRSDVALGRSHTLSARVLVETGPTFYGRRRPHRRAMLGPVGSEFLLDACFVAALLCGRICRHEHEERFADLSAVTYLLDQVLTDRPVRPSDRCHRRHAVRRGPRRESSPAPNARGETARQTVAFARTHR